MVRPKASDQDGKMCEFVVIENFGWFSFMVPHHGYLHHLLKRVSNLKMEEMNKNYWTTNLYHPILKCSWNFRRRPKTFPHQFLFLKLLRPKLAVQYFGLLCLVILCSVYLGGTTWFIHRQQNCHQSHVQIQTQQICRTQQLELCNFYCNWQLIWME